MKNKLVKYEVTLDQELEVGKMYRVVLKSNNLIYGLFEVLKKDDNLYTVSSNSETKDKLLNDLDNILIKD